MSFKIGKNIKNLRIENQMTEQELSTLLLCSINDIKKWENDEAYPDIMMLPKLAKVFNVSIDYLTTGEVITHKNYDQILNKVSMEDNPNMLDDDIIKGIDKKNNSLIDYIIKNESIKIFNYLVKTNKLKYAFNNKTAKSYQDDLIYLALIANCIDTLPQLGLPDISTINKWPDKALNALSTDNRIENNTIDYILSIHKRDITYGEYLYMPNDSRHVKGMWQVSYPIFLDNAVKNDNTYLANQIYNAYLDANRYALNLIKNNENKYQFYNYPLDRYSSQKLENIPIVDVKMDTLYEMLNRRQFSLLKLFNKLNKDLGSSYISLKEIGEEEIKDDMNATDLDVLKIKYVKLGLLNIKEMLNDYKNPSEYDKEVLFTMIKTYPISYIELANNCIFTSDYKKLFEFSIDNEIDNLTKLILNKKYDEIIPYMILIFGYTDVLNDGHVKRLKEEIKQITYDMKKYEEENNSFKLNRCYEKIAKIIYDEKNEWSYNLVRKHKELNRKIYEEMLEAQNETIGFSTLMNITADNVKQISDNYKFKLYNEYLKKVGKNNE